MQLHNVVVEKVLPYRIYTMERCIFCTKSKMLLNKHGIDFEETHLDGNRLENFKKQFTTLPQIYDDEENHIGGYQDLYHLLK